jgi:two-component SAPR family response regulator
MSIQLNQMLNFAFTNDLTDNNISFDNSSKEILVIDSSSCFLNNLPILLINFGLKVRTTGSEFEAIEIYISNQNKIDLIIINLKMPEINGLDLYSIFKSMNSDLKIFLIIDNSIDFSFFMNLGIDALILKPIQFTDLLHLIVAIRSF